MKKHFVTFMSPGTFVSESTTKPIDKWDVDRAVEMAKEIKERYNALPYGFYFTTRKRVGKEFDSHESDRGNMYFLGGDILTLEDVVNRKDPKDRILISNMKGNNYDRVIVNKNSWMVTLPLEDDAVVLEL